MHRAARSRLHRIRGPPSATGNRKTEPCGGAHRLLVPGADRAGRGQARLSRRRPAAERISVPRLPGSCRPCGDQDQRLARPFQHSSPPSSCKGGTSRAAIPCGRTRLGRCWQRRLPATTETTSTPRRYIGPRAAPCVPLRKIGLQGLPRSSAPLRPYARLQSAISPLLPAAPGPAKAARSCLRRAIGAAGDRLVRKNSFHQVYARTGRRTGTAFDTGSASFGVC